ncbi:MAG: hypothetical protein HN509_08515 [Halobacteriovoraceae bacterium]|jgi:hypothetical protein|nr:hypothetical protein [Halobacteriovoraceae bacterium]MBT5095292.1 hypothetical protein [Halobacteriovoraceae bacterium]
MKYGIILLVLLTQLGPQASAASWVSEVLEQVEQDSLPVVVRPGPQGKQSLQPDTLDLLDEWVEVIRRAQRRP